MNQEDINNTISSFYPALLLDRILRRETRISLANIIGDFLVVLALLALGSFGTKGFSVNSPELTFLLERLQVWGPLIAGFLSIFISLWILLKMFEAFYDSYYFQGLATVLPEQGLSENCPRITFEATSVLYDSYRYGDLTAGFIFSSFGNRALVRSGLNKDVVTDFFSKRIGLVDPKLCTFSKKDDGTQVSLSDVVSAIVVLDQEFVHMLSVHDVSPRDLSGASGWIEESEHYFRRLDRFWGKDQLGKIKGIGKDWSYGGAYALEKFARDITSDPISLEDSRSHKAEQDSLEAILARSAEANALLIADEGAGAMDVVKGLGFRITQGSVFPSLEHKRLFLFDANAFIAVVKNKATFESELLHILNQSVRAGNVILVIEDLPDFVESAKSLGSEVIALMDPYLASSSFQVIAIANPGAYHQIFEADSKVLHRFEKILLKDRDFASTMRILQERALYEEVKGNVFFTYQSLVAVAEGIKRYFSDGVLSDRALHLLSELVPAVEAKKKYFVERSDVIALIESKTGIKVGDVSAEERDKLLHLEDILHKRIIGQEEAVKAISNSMRRARADIENPERPMGSFLFLGPTGVGKTETTKALSQVFFGNEDSIIRLDMSEYQTDDALKRLIGSFENGKQGVLASKLRERSYGVLLLDEFEKTNPEVLNLFLQILDEGFFSDMAGRRVNARNLIIVATSNAGSDLIWNLIQSKKNLVDSKEEIVNEIIHRGIFKPELLNRFDGVILFHPLSEEDLRKIADLMLQKLQKRLAEKGIELVINDALLWAVMKAGTDPQFGARPMNRAIQEKVEEVIAKKILSGEAKPGSRLELTTDELR